MPSLSISRLAIYGIFRLVVISLASGVFTSQSVMAQLSELDRSRLAAELRAAGADLDASRFPDVDAAKQRTLASIDNVDLFLAARTTPDNHLAWRNYIAADPLAEAIRSDQSTATIGREAVNLRQRLVGTYPGLELSAMQQLRNSAGKLIAALRFRDQEKSIELIGKQLTALADRVENVAPVPSADDAAAINAMLSVLKDAGQATSTINSMRNVFCRPNVAIWVSEPLVQQAVNRGVNEIQPVRDCILGTRIVGDATLNGNVTANLLPSLGTASMQVALAADFSSNSTGYNGPVVLRTIGYGHVNVSRMLHVSQAGLQLEPVVTDAELTTKITAIEHQLGIVRKIARKKAAQQKPIADRIALNKLRTKVGERFTDQTNQSTAVGATSPIDKIRPYLGRLDLDEPTRNWGSTENALFIDSLFRSGDQIATVVSAPVITEAYDAAVQIHETAVDNALGNILAGRTLKECELNKLLEESGRPIPPPATDEDGEPEPPFEIDFARIRPIIFEARDQTIRIGVRGTRFAQGQRELKRAIEITAIYQPAKSADGTTILLRDGEVDVDFPGKGRLTISQAGLKPTIKKKFSNVFPDKLLDRPLEVPSTASVDALKGRVFRPRQVDAKDGWLTVTIR